MRDRLIEIAKNFCRYENCTGKQDRAICCDCENGGKLADHLLENGVIVLPCRVGDIVYKLCNGKIYDMRAVAIPLLISTCGTHLSVTAENGREACISLDLDDFGKTVFLTREEAEQALKGGE